MGLAGDSASGGDSRANYPILFADLYEPDHPQGNRFRRLGPTLVPRMYHSTACLTTNGTILVAGCDRCYRYQVDATFTFSASPAGKAEYRLEVFYPPFWFQENLKPVISATQSEVMSYNKLFVVKYTWSSPVTAAANGLTVTRVVLSAPCSNTHSYDSNQRLVGLEVVANVGGALTVLGPPNVNIAPPGMYMLFLLNGDVYSAARWVRLVPPGGR